MCDPRWQQRKLAQDFLKPLPLQPLSTCAATQPFFPDALDSAIELSDTAVVRRPAVILVVAAEFGVQGFLLLTHRVKRKHSSRDFRNFVLLLDRS